MSWIKLAQNLLYLFYLLFLSVIIQRRTSVPAFGQDRKIKTSLVSLRKLVGFFNSKSDKLVKSQKASVFVIPAEAGIQESRLLGDRLRGSDGLGDFLRDHQICIPIKSYSDIIPGGFSNGQESNL